MLELEDYLYSALLGLIISVGGITESIVSMHFSRYFEFYFYIIWYLIQLVHIIVMQIIFDGPIISGLLFHQKNS